MNEIHSISAFYVLIHATNKTFSELHFRQYNQVRGLEKNANWLLAVSALCHLYHMGPLPRLTSTDTDTQKLCNTITDKISKLFDGKMSMR